jgi:hypothetical protein
MDSFTTSIRRRLAPCLLLAGAAGVAACSAQVDVAQSAGRTGAGGSTSSGLTATSTTSATTSSSVSSSGSGGSGGSIGPLTCLPGEGAIVVGNSNQHAVVAVQHQGTWSEIPTAVGGGVIETAAYVDVYHQLSVFWAESALGVYQAHFIRTIDGTTVEAHDVQGWHPLSHSPLYTVGSSILVGRDTLGETSLAYFDPDAMDWIAWLSTPFNPTSAAAIPALGATVLVGMGLGNVLCDVTLDSSIAWGPMQCHPELPVATGKEIASPPPQVVALSSGDALAVYFTSYVDLTAAVLHAGQWSAPVTTKLPDQSLSFAVTSTPSGDALAAVVFTSGNVAALRFSAAAGWGAPIAIDSGASTQQRLAGAPGICGDDAVFAYSAGGIDGEVRVARVRGDAAETTKVAKLVEDMPFQISLATRRDAQSP